MRSTLSSSPFAAGTAMALLLAMPAQATDQPPVTLPAPRLVYTSPFAGQLPHADAPPIDWARSNALVGALEGHAGHLRGTSRDTSRGTSAEPPATPNPPATPSPSASPVHGRHGMPGPVR